MGVAAHGDDILTASSQKKQELKKLFVHKILVQVPCI